MTASLRTDVTPDLTPDMEPRHSAPPVLMQQIPTSIPVEPEEEVVWDDSMMELDYEEPEQVPLPKVETTPVIDLHLQSSDISK
jgi:hypothetical protein